MSTDMIAAVQSRVQELQALVAPGSATATSATATSTSAASAAAVQAAAGATGTTTTATGTAAGDFQAALDAATGASGASGTTAAETGIAPGSGVTAQDLVATAKEYLGVPYVWGGESLSEGGLDCSGLVLRSLTDLGVTGVPRTAHEQMHLGTKVASMDDAKPGDLLVFGGGTHIAIYVGDGKMIDAPKPGGHVNIRDVYAEPTAIRRILPQEGAATSQQSALASVSSLAASGSPATGSGLTTSDGTDASRIAWELLAGVAS